MKREKNKNQYETRKKIKINMKREKMIQKYPKEIFFHIKKMDSGIFD